MTKITGLLLLALMAGDALAQSDVKAVSLRLGGKEVPLQAGARERVVAFARDRLARCGPNTLRHAGNFGRDAALTGQRLARVLAGSRLHIVFAASFDSVSHLGGTLQVSEAVIGLESKDLFVGPDFTRHGATVVEHLQCGYLPALELACLPELAAHLPARYRETCAKLERDPQGRIVMPPPDIAPSCS